MIHVNWWKVNKVREFNVAQILVWAKSVSIHQALVPTLEKEGGVILEKIQLS